MVFFAGVGTIELVVKVVDLDRHARDRPGTSPSSRAGDRPAR